MEHKLARVEAVDLKFDPERKGFFSGLASSFNGVDSYGDTIAPGAYVKTLVDRARAIVMRWNHSGPVIGKWSKIEETERGLYVEGELTPNHSVADDVYASLKHGAVSGLSIGFRPVGLTDNGDGTRTLTEIELVEISIVENPADDGALIESVKALAPGDIDGTKTLKDVERLLRDVAGFSRSDATALVSRVKALARGEREMEQHTSDTLAAIRAATETLIRN